MKTIIILIVLSLALYQCGFSINFKPFSINFSEWRSFVGILLMAISFALISNDNDKKAYKKGVNDGIEYVIKELKK